MQRFAICLDPSLVMLLGAAAFMPSLHKLDKVLVIESSAFLFRPEPDAVVLIVCMRQLKLIGRVAHVAELILWPMPFLLQHEPVCIWPVT